MITPPMTTEVRNFAGDHGLIGKLYEMLNKAARVTHPAGNRRYHEWILKTSDGAIVCLTHLPTGLSSVPVRDVRVATPQSHHRPPPRAAMRQPEPKAGEFLAYDDCGSCDGTGLENPKDPSTAFDCRTCGGSGEVRLIHKLTNRHA